MVLAQDGVTLEYLEFSCITPGLHTLYNLSVFRLLNGTGTGRGYIGVPGVLAGLLRARKLYGSDQVFYQMKVQNQRAYWNKPYLQNETISYSKIKYKI